MQNPLVMAGRHSTMVLKRVQKVLVCSGQMHGFRTSGGRK